MIFFSPSSSLYIPAISFIDLIQALVFIVRLYHAKYHLQYSRKKKNSIYTQIFSGIQELVDDPRSRKAQFMMSHLMSEHRAALSQRLSQQRFRPLDTLPDDELRLLNSLDNTQMSSLPPEVVQQVLKNILQFDHLTLYVYG